MANNTELTRAHEEACELARDWANRLRELAEWKGIELGITERIKDNEYTTKQNKAN